MDLTALEREWKISPDDLAQLISENPSLRSFTMGYAAEFMLRRQWFSGPSVMHTEKADDHDRTNKGDLNVTMDAGDEFVFEVKSLQTNSTKWLITNQLKVVSQCDASDRRRVMFPDGRTHETTCLLRGEFDILAVCLFPVLREWEYLFIENKDLDPPTSSTRFKAPSQPYHDTVMTEEDRQFLIKSSHSFTLGPGWIPDPTTYSHDPWSVIEQVREHRLAASDEIEPEIEMIKPKRERRPVDRAAIQAATEAALSSFGPWPASRNRPT